MRTEQISEENKVDLSNSFAIPPCYQNIEKKAEVVSFWNDDEKVSKFMEKRKEEFREKAVKLDFCSICRWDSLCIGIPEKIAGRFSTGSMLLRLGYGCNQKCIFCTVDKYDDCGSKKYITEPTLYGMTTEDANRDILARKPYELTFTGGEPLLRKDLIEVIDFAKENGVQRVVVNTNGVLLSDMKYVDRLKNAGEI